MAHPFSTKGTIGRVSLLICLLLYALSPILGLFACFFVRMLASPIGSVANSFIWSERSAAFVKDHVAWMGRGWSAVVVIALFYLVGQRLIDCAYIKRARAIGVEISSTWLVPIYFLGFETRRNIERSALSKAVAFA